MNLTNTQLDTLKTWITNNAPTQTDEQVTALLNVNASGPNNVGWKTNVPIREIGDKLNGADLAGLSSLNHTRLLTVITISQFGVNASLVDRRQFFDDIFSGTGGATTRANLLGLWKRIATVGEKLFWIGTGTDASPATFGPEGIVSTDNVSQARNRS